MHSGLQAAHEDGQEKIGLGSYLSLPFALAIEMEGHGRAGHVGNGSDHDPSARHVDRGTPVCHTRDGKDWDDLPFML